MSKKQLLSSQTVLLRGAGRTNIEYSAGPNINITDDVISGRDWSQEMEQIVKGGVSASLSGGDNIQITNDQGINIISVTGDLYSAGPNINITDRTISGKDWTNDIDSHIASAISGKADSSAIPEIVEYSAGDNINITDHVVSGKDWSYEIGQKVGRDEFISGMSAVTEHMTEVVSATSGEIIDIISATSGQGGGSCPWISGGKDYGSATEQLQFGSVLPIFSSWGLSGDHNHYIWMKGAYIRLPDIDPYLSSYLPLSAFSSYTASMANNMSSNWAYTNSAYSMSLTNHYNKLDISAWSAFTADADVTPYSAGNGIDITDHVISFTGSEGQTYSAGDNINITNNVISGKSWTDEIIAAVSGKQPSGDYYSASNPSGFITSAGTVNKLDISSYTAYTAAHSGDDNQAYSAGNNINITNHVVSGRDWNPEISGKQDKLSFNYNVDNKISGINGSALAGGGGGDYDPKPLCAGSGVKIDEYDNYVSISMSGGIYSAGSGLDITDNTISITGQVGKVYSGIAPIVVNNTNDTIQFGDYSWTLLPGANVDFGVDTSAKNITVNASAGNGNKITYDYSTPATAYSAEGDMIIKYQTSQSTPARTTVFVADSAVGLLAPNTVNHNSFLMQDYRGSTTWIDASAVVPSSMSAQASYFSKTYTSADSGDSCIPDYPEMNRDWTFNVINWKDSYIYYSAMQGTATLAPGMGVRIHYDLDSDWLDAEPEYSAGGIGTKYLTDVDIQFVSNSAYATESGVLYIITG